MGLRAGWMRGAAFVAGVATAGPAAAGICEISVFDSSFGKVVQEADPVFHKNEQFIICFRPTRPGYVTLWDRMPISAPVERLVPNVNFKGVGEKAARVEVGDLHCFGTGDDGYYLVMEEQDGDGLGLMWLVYTEEEATHPAAASFSSSKDFAASFPRGHGAGLDGGFRAETERPQAASCEGELSLSFTYRVEK